MIIVPVAGDTLKTVDGLPFKVVAYTNYKAGGPAVLCTPASGGETVPLFFKSIASINGKKVTYVKNGEGYKVFETDGYVKRDFQLPQIGETISSDISGVESRKYTVKRIRLNVPNFLTSGMIIDAEEQADKFQVTITLNQITDIEQSLFTKAGFRTYYKDYGPKGTA